MVKLTHDQLMGIIEKHKYYLKNRIENIDYKADLRNAELVYADLRDVNLMDADLRGADLRGANIRNVDLSYANLKGAELAYSNLTCVKLRDANLNGANLRYSALRGADLRSADLRSADLRGADLAYANLAYADLRDAELINANLSYLKLGDTDFSTADLRGVNFSSADLGDMDLSDAKVYQVPPSDGSFIGWKKVCNNLIVKLMVLEDAKRSSAFGRKCRCDKALVLDIQELNGESANTTIVTSTYREDFKYEINKIVQVEDFDENRFEECAPGIHFFITRDEAVDYYY